MKNNPFLLKDKEKRVLRRVGTAAVSEPEVPEQPTPGAAPQQEAGDASGASGLAEDGSCSTRMPSVSAMSVQDFRLRTGLEVEHGVG
jgi:hypothetical protein